ncbi:MAG: AbrB/MazE/SpoVT family DNA-binding domain-containing protein [Armatimonadota bacterium]|nr:AbrB/MazE/SpoVT family DNA-binding domain-containing protein [Armatimonadota bacterium]
MSQSARTKLIKIGNSRGIRIPKAVVERLHLTNDIEMIVKEDHLELRPGRKPREGWADAFREMAERKDDQLPDEPAPTKWDSEEWTW